MAGCCAAVVSDGEAASLSAVHVLPSRKAEDALALVLPLALALVLVLAEAPDRAVPGRLDSVLGGSVA